MSKAKRVSKWASVVPTLDLGLSRYRTVPSSQTYMCVCLSRVLSLHEYKEYRELWDALLASQKMGAGSVIGMLHRQGYIPELENISGDSNWALERARVIVGKAYWTGVRDKIRLGASQPHALHRNGVAYVKQALADLPDDDFKAWLHSQPNTGGDTHE